MTKHKYMLILKNGHHGIYSFYPGNDKYGELYDTWEEACGAVLRYHAKIKDELEEILETYIREVCKYKEDVTSGTKVFSVYSKHKYTLKKEKGRGFPTIYTWYPGDEEHGELYDTWYIAKNTIINECQYLYNTEEFKKHLEYLYLNQYSLMGGSREVKQKKEWII